MPSLQAEAKGRLSSQTLLGLVGNSPMILSVNTIEHNTTLSTRQCLLVRKKNETNTNSVGKDVGEGREARQGMKEKRDGQL